MLFLLHTKGYMIPDKESYTTILATAGWNDTQKFNKGDKAILSNQVTFGNFGSVLLTVHRCSHL